jgi:uncharacterized protein YbaR (Trm112 family)
MHTLGQFVDFVEKIYGKSKSSNNGLNIIVACPECKEKQLNFDETKKKLAIRTDNFWTKCWVCGYKRLSLAPLLKKHNPEYLDEFINKFCGGVIFDDSMQNIENKATILPVGFSLLAEQFYKPQNILAKKAIDYLIDRGATLKDFWYYKYGITIVDNDYANRVIIPSFDSEGKLNYYTSRIMNSYQKFNKYKDSENSKEDIIFNEINIDWKKDLTIVEGCFDLLKCNSNATCLLGKTLEKHYFLFQKIIKHDTPVILCLDNDAKKEQLKIAQLLASYGIFVKLYNIPKKYKDPGQMRKQDFINELPNATIYTLENSLEYRLKMF